MTNHEFQHVSKSRGQSVVAWEVVRFDQEARLSSLVPTKDAGCPIHYILLHSSLNLTLNGFVRLSCTPYKTR